MVQRRSLKGGPGSPQVQKLKTAAGWYFLVAGAGELLLWQPTELQQPAALYAGSKTSCTAGVMQRPAAAAKSASAGRSGQRRRRRPARRNAGRAVCLACVPCRRPATLLADGSHLGISRPVDVHLQEGGRVGRSPNGVARVHN